MAVEFKPLRIRRANNFQHEGGVTRIFLNHGKVATVDTDDYPTVAQYHWYAYPHRNTWYAATRVRISANKTTVRRMHQILLPLNGSVPDHVDGDGLNNRRQNLRPATHVENCFNSLTRPSLSGLRGVTWHKKNKKWVAQLTYKMRNMYLGSFDTQEQAFQARLSAERQYHPDFQRAHA